MLSQSFLAASTLLVCVSAASQAPTLKFRTPTAFKAASPNVVSSHVIELSRFPGSQSAKHLNAIRNGGYEKSGSSNLTSLFDGEEFSTDVTFANSTFNLIVDTGSSDTWLVETGFSCVNVETGAKETEDYCSFGPTWTPTSQFKEIAGENFNITYGDGEFLSGVMGYDSVTLGGITVPKQEIGAVNYAAWDGDGVTSGLLGLAYPAITSAYKGTNPHNDTEANSIPYDPIFITMYKENLTAPVFSLAIERADSGPAGYLALGGLPPVNYTEPFASTPIQYLTVSNGGDAFTESQYTYYVISPQGILYPGANGTVNATGFQAIVDSGTTLNYFPTEIADEVNAAFDPPATWSDYEGAYVVDCNATAPSLAVEIDGVLLYTNAADLILDDGTGTDTCISGIDDAGEDGLPILGDVFLKNVVAVYDVGASELRFAAREFYSID